MESSLVHVLDAGGERELALLSTCVVASTEGIPSVPAASSDCGDARGPVAGASFHHARPVELPKAALTFAREKEQPGHG